MDRSRGYYALEINQRKTKPYDVTYMWNLRSKINEQTIQVQHREARAEGQPRSWKLESGGGKDVCNLDIYFSEDI